MCEILEKLRGVGAELDFISELKTREDAGNPNGTLFGNPFYITFSKSATGKYFMLTVAEGADFRKTLEKLREIASELMGAEPIISYEEKLPDRITFEWDLDDPEGRISKIVNGGEEFARLELSNIELFGERKLTDYLDDAEVQKNCEIEVERVKNAKIYGKFPGGLDVEKIEKMSEHELFELYYALTYEAWAINHHSMRDHARGYMDDEQFAAAMESLEKLQYPIEYLLYFISKKINVPVNEPKVDEHIKPDRELFMKWYEFHDKNLSGDWRESA